MGVGWHMPFMSQMPMLHSSVASAHIPPGAMGCASQLPLTVLQTPLTHPAVKYEQSFGLPPRHCPPEQALPIMQRSPVSEHASPSFVGSGVGSHMPVVALQATLLHSAYGEKLQ